MTKKIPIWIPRKNISSVRFQYLMNLQSRKVEEIIKHSRAIQEHLGRDESVRFVVDIAKALTLEEVEAKVQEWLEVLDE